MPSFTLPAPLSSTTSGIELPDTVSRRTALAGVLAAATTTAVPTLMPHDAQAATSAAKVRALRLARTFVGRVPYVYGGTTPGGFDCSGLTQYVYRRSGLSVPRTAQDQRDATRYVRRSRATAGDLVFFHSDGYVYHVGVYAGAGRMVDAGSRRSGIRYRSIWSSDISFGTV